MLIPKPCRHFTYVTTHYPTVPSLYLRHSSFSNPSVTSPTSQFILQPFFRFSYATSSSLSSPREPPMTKIEIRIASGFRKRIHACFWKLYSWDNEIKRERTNPNFLSFSVIYPLQCRTYTLWDSQSKCSWASCLYGEQQTLDIVVSTKWGPSPETAEDRTKDTPSPRIEIKIPDVAGNRTRPCHDDGQNLN